MPTTAKSKVHSSVPMVALQVTKDPDSLNAATVAEIDLDVTGAEPGMAFVVNAPDLETDLVLYTVGCKAVGKVTIRLYNPTGAPINAASQVFEVRAL